MDDIGEQQGIRKTRCRPRRSTIWTVGVVGFLGLWWQQPYYGWSVCALPTGLYHETDFVEALYQPVLDDAIGRIQGSGFQERHPLVDEARVEEVVRAAFDLMKECVDERGLEFCRYVGPDENGSVFKQQDPDRVPNDQQHMFKYIDTSADVSMSILRNGDIRGGDLDIDDHAFQWGYSQDVCDLGCGCY